MQKFCGLDIFWNCFPSALLSLFSKPSSTTTTTTNHYLPIMTKMTSNLTTSHETPVKSTPSKLVIKNQHLRIEDKQIQTRLGGKPWNQSSPVSVSTAMTALSILLSQLTATVFTSSTQFNSSNLVRTLDFPNLLAMATATVTAMATAMMKAMATVTATATTEM
jgi:hypothetical protein